MLTKYRGINNYHRHFLMALAAFACIVAPGCLEPATVAPADAVVGRTVVHDTQGILLPASVFPGVLPVMEQRYVANKSAIEPTLAITASGAVFYPTHLGGIHYQDPLGGEIPVTKVMRTRDAGLTWDDVTPDVAGQDQFVISGDPYLYADPIGGRIFTVDAYLACNYISFSDDEGDSWIGNPAACGAPLADHETVFSGPATQTTTIGYPAIIYQCFNQIVQSLCARSLDGGITWSPGTPVFGPQDGAAECGGTHGHGHAGPDGTVYLPKGHCGEPWLGISRDDGVTWQRVRVTDSVGMVDSFTTDTHEAAVRTDAEGNVYYFVLDQDGQPRLAVSRDAGATWGEPMLVGLPGLTAARWPSLVAGDEGRVAVFYVGSDVAGGFDANEEVLANATWHAYAGFILNALDPDPIVATARMDPDGDPIARGRCEGGGGACGVVYDFLDVEMDAGGRVYAALVDVCTGPCAAPGGSAADPGDALAAIGVQVAGSTLRAGVVIE